MSDFDEQERRIAGALSADEVPEVNDRTLRAYLAYLKKNLTFPCYYYFVTLLYALDFASF
jgi:hypothetical protein